MAIKSTIVKANLQIADIDHGYYADHALTLARHPSETDERMMVRLAALAIQAHQLNDLCNGDATLAFGAGLSDPDDPDASLTDFTGRKRVWIEVGQREGVVGVVAMVDVGDLQVRLEDGGFDGHAASL
jgi:uncharacterized protein YaeQ